jgi:dethiobiotin synthetase
VIVVAANRLGAINHLTLTLEAAASRGLTVLGYVWNLLEPQPSLAAETNLEALSFLTAVPCLGEIPYIASGDVTHGVLPDVFEAQVGRAVERALMRR